MNVEDFAEAVRQIALKRPGLTDLEREVMREAVITVKDHSDTATEFRNCPDYLAGATDPSGRHIWFFTASLHNYAARSPKWHIAETVIHELGHVLIDRLNKTDRHTYFWHVLDGHTPAWADKVRVLGRDLPTEDGIQYLDRFEDSDDASTWDPEVYAQIDALPDPEVPHDGA